MTEAGTKRLVRLIELAVILALSVYAVRIVEAGASLMHVGLPVMPLLKRTYLFFGFILIVCLYMRLKGEKLSSFGLVVPRRWLVLIGRGLLVFVVAMVFDMVGRPLIDPLIAHMTGTSPTLAEQHFASLKGNLPMLLYLIPMGCIFGAFGEEIFYRGIVMTRIAQVLGEGRAAWIAALFLQAIPFAIGHSYQGPVGMVAIYVIAVITGASTLIWGRNLWPAIVAHGIQDTFGFIMLYAGLVHG